MSIYLSGSLAPSPSKDLLQYSFGFLSREKINLDSIKENNIKSVDQNQNDQYFGQNSFDNLYKNNQTSLMALLFFL